MKRLERSMPSGSLTWKSGSESQGQVKSNPDKAQRPLRQQALEEGKLLYMAVPRLRDEKCFVELDPAVMACTPAQGSTISGAFRHGRPVFCWRRCGKLTW